MITALSVVTPEKGRGIKRLINTLKRDKITVELKKSRGVSIKQITCISRRGTPDFQKIDRFVGAQRNHLLCALNLALPESSGYRRFYSPVFTARLCTNMALSVIGRCKSPESLVIGVYDPNGALHGFLSCILQYCCDVYVVTDNPQSYQSELEAAMEQLGAAAVVTKQRGELSRCDVVVAPVQITEELPLKDSALVFTNNPPKSGINGTVLCKYYFKMPCGFDKIKPRELEEDYFCSALYTLGGQYELGSIIPTLCRAGSSTHTVRSLCAYLERST